MLRDAKCQQQLYSWVLIYSALANEQIPIRNNKTKKTV